MTSNSSFPFHGVLLVNKPSEKTSFSLIRALRKQIGEKKIGHTGTLDPFAQGLMILLIGRNYTKHSLKFLNEEKEYRATIQLGVVTDTYDCQGKELSRNDRVPSLSEVESALNHFQGAISQIPPMFSAKKKNGKKLYQLARKGIEIPREPISITLKTEMIEYRYPFLTLNITCSKGTYVRSLAFDLGEKIGVGAHLKDLIRTRSGNFLLEDAFDGSLLYSSSLDLNQLQQKIRHENN